MKVSTFIERPVLSAVISITIMVAGIIGLFTLPVEQYPDIAPPTVMVSTTYFGANAETMQKSVVAPLEEAINGVEDMTYMTSTATNSGTALKVPDWVRVYLSYILPLLLLVLIVQGLIG